ncbi:MAG: NUDIX domain-containing protein [Steroidobacteraceae bacterium]|nr:NUDIX domain-containing protein [Steroidobacteraceae bacterium]MDW8257982.1 NUDIX domain-containing protein [Gammaproteobacteria bacterium]
MVVVRREGDQWLCLLLRAYRHWDFPKGLVEPGEQPLAAARREVLEESAIDDLHFLCDGASIDTGPYSRNKVARYFIAETRTAQVRLPVNPDLGAPEHHEWRWVPLAEAREMVAPRLEPVIDWALRCLERVSAGGPPAAAGGQIR